MLLTNDEHFELTFKIPARGGSRGGGGGLRGGQLPLWEGFKLVWLPMSIPFSYQK